MTKDKYVGMDVHSATTVINVMSSSGKTIAQAIIETKAESLKDYIRGLTGTIHVTLEEGVHATWLYDLIKPLVAELIVCDPRENKLLQSGSKTDRVDARRLAELLRIGSLKPVYHGDRGTRTLKELVRSYNNLVDDCVRTMNRIKAIYRGRGISCRGKQVYELSRRTEWLGKLTQEHGAGARAAILYREFDSLNELRRQAREQMVAEARRHPCYKLLKGIPSLGPVRVAQIIAIVSSPFRFRTKRQFWPYCGLAVVTVSSADYEIIQGEIRRSRKPVGTRGLNRNHNRRLKRVFKSAAVAASKRPPFDSYFARMIEKGIAPEKAMLTVARKIAAITLAVWKKGQKFDSESLIKKAA